MGRRQLHRIAPRALTGIAILVVTTAVLAVIVALPSARTINELRLHGGVLELGPGERGTVQSLTGTWQAAPGRVVPPSLFDYFDWTTVDVPGTSSDYRTITYRARITGLNPGVEYALYIMDLTGNGRIFINGHLEGYMGPREITGALLPGFVPRLFPAVPRGPEIEVVIQVENMSHARTGIWQDIYFGPRDEVIRFRDRVRGIELFISGAILLMALYHLILYWLNPLDRSTLFFALFTIAVALKTLLSGHQVLLYHFDVRYQVPWIRLAFASVTAAVPLFLFYLRELFPDHVHRRVAAATAILATVQLVLVLVLPFPRLQVQFHQWQVLIVAGFGYAAWRTIEATRDHVAGAGALFGGLVFLFVFTLNDILFDMGLIHTGFLLSAGLFGFLFSQAVVLAVRYDVLFQETRALREDLEEKVAVRTAELERLARQDPLTGLINRRHGGEVLLGEVRRFLRYGTTLSLVLIDVDHFKEINDTRGHQVGDDVLVGLASMLQNSTRATDRVSRWGGEEFLLILPETTEEQAAHLAQKLRETLAARPLETRAGSVAVTFSGGIIGTDRFPREELADGDGTDAHEAAEERVVDRLLRHADLALYAAKNGGRNRVVHVADIRT